MTLVMTSLPLARVFQRLFIFSLVSASCWLAEIRQLSLKLSTAKYSVKTELKETRLKLLKTSRVVISW